MVQSMTGYAARTGSWEGWSWSWEIRSVNGRGRDIRLRLPDRIEGLEPAVREAVSRRVARGNVTVSLRLDRAAQATAMALDGQVLEQTLALLGEIAGVAAAQGIPLAPTSAAQILTLPGVQKPAEASEDTEALRDALLADLEAVLDAFLAARRAEGEALKAVVAAQLDRIEALTAEVRRLAEERAPEQAEALRAALGRVTENVEAVDPDRLAQELALIAVKSDVTEELDRLDAHVAAARKLLEADGPVGRKLDFLTQEFNREANTLCSKSSYAPLTAVGLDLKAVIDQMREQVQNLE
ncbi:MAG: YicC family protein [Alphaproteobacteria bacterium]|nr:MAG: YicC family protein [Alphaproteobacteria bacterium]